MAIPYQLPNGKTVMLTIDQALNMDDLALQELMAKDVGFELDDPFTNINYRDFKEKEYETPDIEDAIKALDEDCINDIKKEIDNELE